MNIKKQFQPILIALTITILAACGGGGGSSSSTPSAPACQATVGVDLADYKNIANYAEFKSYLQDDSTSNSKYNLAGKYLLTADLTLDASFATINSFSGTLNGACKSINKLDRPFIKDLTGTLSHVIFKSPEIINKDFATTRANLAFDADTIASGIVIKLASGATIDSVKVETPKITSTSARYVAGLVANSEGMIKNSLVSGGTITSGAFVAAGLVAYNDKSVNNSRAINVTVSGNRVAGALIGEVSSEDSLAIENSCASGTLSIQGTSNTSGIGYIVAYGNANLINNPGKIKNSSYKPKFTGSTPDHWGVGSAWNESSKITFADDATFSGITRLSASQDCPTLVVP